ncbi:hypothetical protein HDF22_001541 [Mucilaginibacter lappiensis]|uniref:Uncharacterized protein n=1 Tax=Mucilaginibacter lappiensis TaxID=354630 RepID=A0A841J8L9_9SPHI|nr:hypothetical protein [Mucilaginibacter lappiensis]
MSFQPAELDAFINALVNGINAVIHDFRFGYYHNLSLKT